MLSKRKDENAVSTLFISYTECDTPIVEIIEKKIHEKLLHDKIKISRYTELEYKDSISKFMNTIQDHDFVLAIVSDTYLKRQACMYEMGEVIKDHNYKRKLLFIVLSEKERKHYGQDAPEKIAADIYDGADSRLEYTLFWKDKYTKLEKKIEEVGDFEATIEENKDLQEIGQIYKKDIGKFLRFLSDEVGRNFQKMYENDFEELVEWMFPQYKNIFYTCEKFDDLLIKSIEELHQITKTDYNQIALGVKIDSHQTGLVVFADDIVNYKQRYRLVAMDGVMAKSYVTGQDIIIGDVEKEDEYFCAVSETKSELVLPIEYEGKVIGVFNSESEEKNYYGLGMTEKLAKILEYFSFKIIELGYVGNMDQSKLPYVHI